VSAVIDDKQHEFIIIKSDDLHIAGYASLEIVDKQNDLITLKALDEATKKFIKNPKYRNVMTNHSNVQVGEVVKEYRDSKGKLWKTEVDDVGFFVVIKLRDDIEKAKEVSRDIRKGTLRSFSIGGQALQKVKKSHKEHGEYNEISKLELHEITICEKGINPEARFDILKMDEKKMSKLEKAIEELNELMKGCGENMTGEYMETDDELDLENQDEEMVDEPVMDDLPEELDDSVAMSDTDLPTGQVEAGEVGKVIVEGGSPKNKHDQITVVKGFNVNSLDLSEGTLEKAYEQFKAEKLEKMAYDNLTDTFQKRLDSEITEKNAEIAKSEYDAHSEVTELKKQFSELLTYLQDNKDNTIIKQQKVVEELQVPSSEDIAKMSWGELDAEIKRMAGE
jgi:HK97 family phage prohead protease|tara:strand:+ start:2527 stop:3705 length:1179 start_codon:yes stop_codon:yes gene_type:complete